MAGLTDWGVEVIRALQGLPIIGFFKIITTLGSEIFYLLALPIFWVNCRREFSVRFSVVLLLSAVTNMLLKDWVALDRPFVTYPDVFVYKASGYSFPSGHAQLAMTFWGMLCVRRRSSAFWGMSAVLIFLIGLSRPVLGVHYPTDIFSGWVIGVGFVGTYLFGEKLIAQVFANKWGYAVLALGALVLAWVQGGRDVGAICGAICGLSLGIGANNRWLPVQPLIGGKKAVSRTLLSLLGTVLLYVGLKLLFARVSQESTELVFRFLRFAAVGAWASFGGVWLGRHLFPKGS